MYPETLRELETKETGHKKLDKRQAIVDAARSLFTTAGYEATTIADVARKAGVAVGTVYLYFKNKTELLYALKGDWETEYLELMARPELQAIPHHKRARSLIEASFAMCAQQTDMVQLMGLSTQMMGELYKTDTYGPVQQALKAFLDEARELGSLRPVDTKAAAIMAFSMVESVLEQCFQAEGGQNEQLYIDALVDAFEHWLVKPELLEG